MKKIFGSFILILVFIMIYLVCINSFTEFGIVNAKTNDEKSNARFVFIDVQYESRLYIGRYYDTQTKVIYMFTRNGTKAGGLTVMVDAEGKPLLYNE